MFLKGQRGHANKLLLGRIAVGHQTRLEVIGTARRIRQHLGHPAAGTGLSRRYPSRLFTQHHPQLRSRFLQGVVAYLIHSCLSFHFPAFKCLESTPCPQPNPNSATIRP